MSKALKFINQFQNRVMNLNTVEFAMNEIKNWDIDEKIEFLIMLQFAEHDRFWESVVEKETKLIDIQVKVLELSERGRK